MGSWIEVSQETWEVLQEKGQVFSYAWGALVSTPRSKYERATYYTDPWGVMTFEITSVEPSSGEWIRLSFDEKSGDMNLGAFDGNMDVLSTLYGDMIEREKRRAEEFDPGGALPESPPERGYYVDPFEAESRMGSPKGSGTQDSGPWQDTAP